MHATPFLFFNGTCAEALDFYRQAIGAKIEGSMTYGASPAAGHVPAELHDKIIHSMFRIGDTMVMASDARPDLWTGDPRGFSLCISAESVAEAETLFAALSAGGTVEMAMEETFFAERFGSVTDKFGIEWMVIFEKKHG